MRERLLGLLNGAILLSTAALLLLHFVNVSNANSLAQIAQDTVLPGSEPA